MPLPGNGVLIVELGVENFGTRNFSADIREMRPRLNHAERRIHSTTMAQIVSPINYVAPHAEYSSTCSSR